MTTRAVFLHGGAERGTADPGAAVQQGVLLITMPLNQTGKPGSFHSMSGSSGRYLVFVSSIPSSMHIPSCLRLLHGASNSGSCSSSHRRAGETSSHLSYCLEEERLSLLSTVGWTVFQQPERQGTPGRRVATRYYGDAMDVARETTCDDSERRPAPEGRSVFAHQSWQGGPGDRDSPGEGERPNCLPSEPVCGLAGPPWTRTTVGKIQTNEVHRPQETGNMAAARLTPLAPGVVLSCVGLARTRPSSTPLVLDANTPGRRSAGAPVDARVHMDSTASSSRQPVERTHPTRAVYAAPRSARHAPRGRGFTAGRSAHAPPRLLYRTID
ncbi:unnamed protein product [Boreogadus saida]